jgi:hypothetical protein
LLIDLDRVAEATAEVRAAWRLRPDDANVLREPAWLLASTKDDAVRAPVMRSTSRGGCGAHAGARSARLRRPSLPRRPSAAASTRPRPRISKAIAVIGNAIS